jgi:cytochrome c oxidase subunit II
MIAVSTPVRTRLLVRLLPAALLTSVVVLAACGSDSNDAAPAGERLAKEYGCAACHTLNGDKGVGPTWKGLFGSTVELQDGRTLVVDREYLVRAITDPGADVPVGNKVPMPVNRVPKADVEQIVEYIVGLGG